MKSTLAKPLVLTQKPLTTTPKGFLLRKTRYNLFLNLGAERCAGFIPSRIRF
jgi:hypothetical protein